MRVQPGASADRVEDAETDASGRTYLKVRVRARPDKGLANKAVEQTVAKWLGLPKTAVRVVTGTKTRLKGLEIDETPEVGARIEKVMSHGGNKT